MRLRLVGLALSLTLLGAALAPPTWAADAPAPYAPPPGAAAAPAAAPVPAPAATPAAPATPAAAPPAATDPNDEVLRRVLRSGCRDGLPEVRSLAAGGATAWAPTVGRLCGEILASPQAATAAPRLVVPSAHRERDGRAAIVIASSIYGIWVGIASDVLLNVDSVRGAIVAPLLGMGAGLGLSFLVTQEHHLENGQSWTIITGMDYGSLNGALWGGGLDLSAKEVVGTALATGLAAGAIGVLVADKMRPRQGDIEVVRSGLLWGTLTGVLGMVAVSPSTSDLAFVRGMAVSMDLGFLAGLALAASFDVSRNRDLIIDSGTLGGGFVGFGVTWLIAGTENTGRSVAAGTLAGMYAGMAATIYLTRNMDRDDDQEDASPVAAVLGRDQRGRWHWGAPGPTPVMDGNGRRVVGATLNVLGGTF